MRKEIRGYNSTRALEPTRTHVKRRTAHGPVANDTVRLYPGLHRMASHIQHRSPENCRTLNEFTSAPAFRCLITRWNAAGYSALLPHRHQKYPHRPEETGFQIGRRKTNSADYRWNLANRFAGQSFRRRLGPKL